MSPRTATKVGYEPIPGYTLRKRLGAGGYGDVWLADAPGGLQKAVKLIYGTVDQSHAISELKSLDRLRQVYHPFLLSLERIEVVDNQVVIVTELAEGSLLDRFEQYRKKGDPGIPRAILLDFLRDTADALDFLAQKHSLQHLDVKPGNLLIIADRIKVADFGLVKDIHERDQSLVSGLTPTYSAPEIFDGRPDIRSDQYSLAIVYMEMLTGRLPFVGKSTGELARQHIDQTPDLDALPPADRPVVARALSKKPLDRFATSRLFIEQLLKTRGGAVPQLTKASVAEVTAEAAEIATGTVEPKSCTASFNSASQEFQPRLDVASLGNAWQTPFSMFVGVGGMGCLALQKLRESLDRNFDSHRVADDHGWLAIDTTAMALDHITDPDQRSFVPSKHAIQIPIRKLSETRRADVDLFGPLSRRWLYNVPRSMETEGVRPLAILSLLDHYEALKSKFKFELKNLVKRHTQAKPADEPLRIYIMSSLHGGTGSGLVCELGMLVRRIMHELSFNHYRICAVVSAATTINNSVANLPSAAALACLAEMTYLMQDEHDSPSIYFGDGGLGTTRFRPFDWVTLVDGGLHANPNDADATIASLAHVAFLDSQTLQGAVLAEDRTQASSQSGGWLRTACANPIQIGSRVDSQELARRCAAQSIINAIQYMSSSGSKPAIDPSQGKPSEAIGESSRSNTLANKNFSEFAQRLLRDLDVVEPQGTFSDLASLKHGKRFLGNWARRLSDVQELVEQQIQQDIETWKGSISKIIQMRLYTWKHIEHLQQCVLEGLLEFSERNVIGLARFLAPFSNILGSEERMAKSAAEYLRRVSHECFQLLRKYQNYGKGRTYELRSWCASLEVDTKTAAEAWQFFLSGLPAQLQLVAHRVNSQLESTLHREDTLVLVQKPTTSDEDVAIDASAPNQIASAQGLVSNAAELVSQIANQIGIDESLLNEGESDADERTTLDTFSSYVPAISQSGGKVFRFIVAPTEQMQTIENFLAKARLQSSTTLVPTLLSLGAHVACDASQIELRSLIASFWRPIPATFQLAERLRTRIDLEWDPVSDLVECTDEIANATGESEAELASEPGSKPSGVISLGSPDSESYECTAHLPPCN